MFPVLFVALLMVGAVVGTRMVELRSLKVTLLPGLQSVAVRAGQMVTVGLTRGSTWRGGGLVAGAYYAAIAPQSGSAPATFPAPPAIASFVASWTPGGSTAEAGSVLLLVPPGQTGSSVVSDPTGQAFAATTLAAVGAKGAVAGITFGRPGSTQTFSQALASFQTWCNGANVLGSSGVQIRNDGVLDYATLSLLASASSGLF